MTGCDASPSFDLAHSRCRWLIVTPLFSGVSFSSGCLKSSVNPTLWSSFLWLGVLRACNDEEEVVFCGVDTGRDLAWLGSSWVGVEGYGQFKYRTRPGGCTSMSLPAMATRRRKGGGGGEKKKKRCRQFSPVFQESRNNGRAVLMCLPGGRGSGTTGSPATSSHIEKQYGYFHCAD